jgi:hypothetical protein
VPTTPEAFFDLVGMAEWFALGERFQSPTSNEETSDEETAPWA